MKNEGIKFDSEKLRWDLLPFDALEEVVKVYTYGATKYEDRNWEKGIKYSRIIGALLRHLVARISGKIFNKDDGGVRHTAQIAWNALALLAYELRGMVEFDDMPNKLKNTYIVPEKCAENRTENIENTWWSKEVIMNFLEDFREK